MDTNDAYLKHARTRTALVLSMIAILGATEAFAEFDAEVIAGATHTDNVFLAAEDEQDELVYRIEPSFVLSHEAPRLTTNIDYLLQAFRYRELEETEVHHQYQASLRAALIPENLFFEIGGSREQSIRDPEQSIPQSNLPISGNRQDRDQYYAAPSFQLGLGSSVLAEGEYRYTWIDYDEEETPGFNTQGNEQAEGRLSIDNYRQAQGVAWALRYDWQRTEYDEELIPWEYQKAMAEIGFWAGENTRLFASGGLESAWDQPLDPALEDTIWEVGLFRTLGERFTAEIAAGERSFGTSWRGSLDFQFRRGSTTLSYAQTPTTEGRQHIRLSDVQGPQFPDDLLSRPGSAERFISNRLEWRLDLEFQRSALSLAAFDANHSDRTLPDGTPLGDESYQGGSLMASYRIGARTDLRIDAILARRELIGDVTTDLLRATGGLDYRLGPRTLLSFEYEYTEEDGDVASANRFYTANSVSLFITRTLF
jgi:hypothetical protein